MGLSQELIGQSVKNPGSLADFLNSGGSQEAWHVQLTEFHRHQESLGLTDTELLQRGGLVAVEYIEEEVS